TVMVRDINPGVGSSSDGVFESRLFEFDGMAFFGANSGDNFGLWKSDGTFAGTELVQGGLIPAAFEVVGDTLYFLEEGTTPASAIRLWGTDGTTPGTMLLKSFDEGGIERDLAGVGDTLFFAAGSSFFE